MKVIVIWFGYPEDMNLLVFSSKEKARAWLDTHGMSDYSIESENEFDFDPE